MAIYCNTLKGNTQYGIDPYCYIPTTLVYFRVMSIRTDRQTDRPTAKFHVYVGLAQAHPNNLIISRMYIMHMYVGRYVHVRM